MNFTNLLKPTIRLADTYDLARTPGSTNFQVGAEDRRKLSTGIWFQLATQLIEYLHIQDSKEPMAYHSIESFFESLDESFVGFTIEDMKYMVNYLSKEFEIKVNDGGIQTVKATTPLIEKRSYGFRCRLSQNGFTAISLSYAAEELLYGDQIASQVEKALVLGDFERYIEYSDKLINMIVSQSYELIALQEKSGKNELRENYKNRSAAYLDTLDSISGTTASIADRLNHKDTEKLVDDYLTNNPENHYIEGLLYIKLEQINNALLSFRSNLSNLLKLFYSLQESVFPTVDFTEVALSILYNKTPVESQENLLSLYGFWGLPRNIACPDFDLLEIIPIQEKQKVTRTTFTQSTSQGVKDRLQEYIEENIDPILEEIEKNGFFSISSAIDNNILECESIEDFTSIVGFCLTPSGLNQSGTNLVISTNPDAFCRKSVDNHTVTFNDLILKKDKLSQVKT